MALQKQKVSIPFAQGLETKEDDKQTPLGSLSALENVILDNPNKIRKRNGYSNFSTKTVNGESILNIKTVTSFIDELGLTTDKKYYSYSKTAAGWLDRGNIETIYPTSQTVIRNDHQQSNVDGVHVEGIEIFAWQDSRGGVRTSVIDRSANTKIVHDVEVSATGINPRVVNIGNTGFILYIDGTDIKYRKINSANGQLESENTITSTLNASNKIYDAVTIANRIFIGWCSSSSSDLQLTTLTDADVVGSTITVTGETPTVALELSTDSASRVVISYYDGTDVKVTVRSFTLGVAIVSPTSVETIANITNVTTTSLNGTFYTFYEQSASNTYDHRVRKNSWNLAASIGTADDHARSLGLAARAFSYNSDIYTVCVHESTLQSTYFVIDLDKNLIGRVAANLAGGLISDTPLPAISQITSTQFLFTSQIKGRNVLDDGTFFSLLGVNSTELDFSTAFPNQAALQGDNLLIAGGILKQYDGANIVEHGFLLFPENLTDGGTATTGGSLTDGTRQYSAVYRWTDNKGLEHLSAPSIPIEITLSGGTSTQTQDITIPTLRLTQKQNVVIDLYRTESNATLFYKVTSISSPEYNDPTVDSITITDITSDANLISGELLYTTGGVLDNIAAPASQIAEEFKNRVVLAGLDNPNKIVYSKIKTEGRPIEFNDTLQILLNDEGGEITAVKTVDDKMIVFKRSNMYSISGDGPNNLGEQDNFTEPELIASDIGCVNARSLVLTPLGIMFQSLKGIYLLTKGLGLNYIGAPVEAFNAETVTSAVVVGDRNQVRFTTQNSDCLVYNYEVNKWSSFTNHRGISAVEVEDQYYYLRPDNKIYREDRTSFTDAGSPIKMAIETDWMNFAGVQGFQRAYRMMLLGEYKSPHKLKLEAAYNFNPAFIQEKIVDFSEIVSDSKYGSESPYGTGSPYGGNGNVYQIRFDFKKQKCQTIKVRIEELQSSNYGEGLELSNMAFELGGKQGLFKLSQSKIKGTS